ncbi:ATP-binding protein [Paeniroseomonas aquatica]|uniref:histidine kinase n=1 Tax=Paeniroseomonas aquatica TaxID=373043 RepID=A0ABT8AGK1_9PROT|nr:ATP-binding protein [Paeniroseomonas aquatica]MDN3568810.1 ATP-binding protein [Paeniroseomonas aquatica]
MPDSSRDCDQEPIHTPGSIQPHGHLLAMAAGGTQLTHISAGADAILTCSVEAAFGQALDRVLACATGEVLRDGFRQLPAAGPLQLGLVRMHSGEAFHVIGHRAPDGHGILEFEAADEAVGGGRLTLEELYPGVRDAFARLGRAASVQDLADTAAAEVRRITGFDRVLVYRFEENWDGTVIAEDRGDRLPSYLGLRFPASDIPAQARRLYELNPQRLIADVDYREVPILAQRPGPPLDLTFANLRSVSPVHRDYMRNMGSPASMSISIQRGDGQLWGLVSCHHAVPRRVSFAIRNACDLLAQMFSVRVAAREEMAHVQERARLTGLEGRLLARMTGTDHFEDGLLAAPGDLLALTGATGAAVLAGDRCTLVGATPTEAEVRRLGKWLAQRGQEPVLDTNALSVLQPLARDIAGIASGLLAISVSQIHSSFVLWFRPEVIRTVTWGGDPRKTPQEQSGRLSPRTSFSSWAETVRWRALPWSAAEVEAARNLRNAIIGVVLRSAEERAELSGRLERVNRELAAFSYSVSHDLRAPFRHIVGFAELLRETEAERFTERGRRYVATIVEAAATAGRLVDALLNFSQMGRAALVQVEFDPAVLVAEARRLLTLEQADRAVAWRIGPMPVVQADPAMLRQVFQNLLSNALKYTRNQPEAVIEVGCETAAEEFVFHVRDNGAGFDMAYAHKLFGVFQRLHRAEEFEGIGIGLANVQRIVERHGGRIWADAKPGKGAVFRFTLPRRSVPPQEVV